MHILLVSLQLVVITMYVYNCHFCMQHVRDNERCLTNKSEEKGKVRNRNMSAPVVRKEATVNSKRKKTPASDFGRPKKPDAVSTSRRTTPGTKSKPVNGKPPKSPHKENQADSDSDATIGNQSDTDLSSPVTTPVMRKSLSLDERKLKKTINPSLNSVRIIKQFYTIIVNWSFSPVYL